jgi:hypothetical protein
MNLQLEQQRPRPPPFETGSDDTKRLTMETFMNDRPETAGAASNSGRALMVADTERSSGKTIIVNGREHGFEGDKIGRDELARIAFPTIGAASSSALTVTYDNGPEGQRHGLLGIGSTTRVLEGQTFSVSLCDKS